MNKVDVEHVWDQLAEIEADSFLWPWTREELQSLIRDRGYKCRILQDSDTNVVAGYVLFCIRGSVLQIHSLATRKEFRRRGYARLALSQLLDEFHGKYVINAYLPAVNIPGQEVLEHCGFRLLGSCRPNDDKPKFLIFTHHGE